MFEQRISDEQVQAARRRIDSGEVSLRAAAGEIGCAPSTLSERIKQAKDAEAEALARAGVGDPKARPSRRPRANADLPASAAEVEEDQLGPIELLRAAMRARKTNGQPDWPTRMSAVRVLAALRPEELEPEQEADEQSPATVVYDLPPGSAPVLHRAQPGTEAPPGRPATQADALPEPGTYVLLRDSKVIRLVTHAIAEGERVHVSHSTEDAAEVLRAFGGDLSCLDTPADHTLSDPEPQPDSA